MAGPRTLEKIEFRPLRVSASQEAQDACRERLRHGVRMPTGEILSVQRQEFAVVQCVPQGDCVVGPSTEIVFGTEVVPGLSRVSLCCLDLGSGGAGCAEEALYGRYVRPFLEERQIARNAQGDDALLIVSQDQLFAFDESAFGVRALDPSARYGAVTMGTEVYVSFVEMPALARIHVLPYEHTLPTAYSANIFTDYLQPFFHAHPFAMFVKDEIFGFRGVQFRVVGTDPPDVAARVDRNTFVFADGPPLRPTLADAMMASLPPEVVEEIRRLPRGVQMFYLGPLIAGARLEGALRTSNGMPKEAADKCGVDRPWSEERYSETQSMCTICLSSYEEGQTTRVLPCEHIFHPECIVEWLMRSPTCPVCKQDCSKANRNALRGGEASLLLSARAVLLATGRVGTITSYDEGAGQFRIALEGGGEALSELEGFVRSIHGVRLFNLSQQNLNGAIGQIVQFSPSRRRYEVAIYGLPCDAPGQPIAPGSGDGAGSGAPQPRCVAVRPANLILPTGVWARVEGLTNSAALRWNGRLGRVMQFEPARGRYTISMACRGELLCVGTEHLLV